MKNIWILGTTAELIKCWPILRRLDVELSSLWSTSQQASLGAEVRSSGFDIARAFEGPVTFFKSERLGFAVWSFRTLVALILSLLRARTCGLADFVTVHGDTTTAVLGATAARIVGIPVIHIEAGLRSGRISAPFPEELNRIILDGLSTYHLAPTKESHERLGLRGKRVFFTNGNSAVDAIREFPAAPPEFGEFSQPFGLVALHRSELLSNRAILEQSVSELVEAALDTHLVLVMDPRTEKALGAAGLLDKLQNHANILTIGKLPFAQFKYLLEKSFFVITDSGGQQQECDALGKRCLVHRAVTETPLSESGIIRLSYFRPGEIVRFIRSVRRDSLLHIANAKNSEAASPSELSARVISALLMPTSPA